MWRSIRDFSSGHSVSPGRQRCHPRRRYVRGVLEVAELVRPTAHVPIVNDVFARGVADREQAVGGVGVHDIGFGQQCAGRARLGVSVTLALAIDPFESEQSSFHIEPWAEADEPSVGPDNPVARDHQRKRIAGHHLADGSRRTR